MNQAEFFQSNQVDGQLTDMQMGQMLGLPEGDTTFVESSVPDAAAVVDPAAGVVEAKVDAPAVILAKDGVHTIPFEKLTEAREAEQHWRSVAAEQQKQIEALGHKPAAEVASPADEAASILDGDVFGDYSEEALAKGVNKLVEARVSTIQANLEARLNAALEPIQRQREVSATDAHFDAIKAAHPDFESIGQSQELSQWIEKQPSFVREGYGKVITEGTADQAIELFSAFKAATGKLSTTPGRPSAVEVAQAAMANAKSKPPSSLSEIPAGSGVLHDEAAAMLEMSGAGLMSKFEGKTPEQINAITLNTLTGAVSEYTGFGFQSITPTHAGSATGLFALGGDTDAGQPIVASITTGKQQWGASLKKLMDSVYFAIKGSGTSTLTVIGESARHSYPFPVRDTGESRAKAGRGIRENYLAFGYSNTDGADFQLDRIEVLVVESKNRRL